MNCPFKNRDEFVPPAMLVKKGELPCLKIVEHAVRRGRKPRRKVCAFCVDKIEYIDYKEFRDVNSRMRRNINERGKIMPRRMSGNCAKHQRQLSEAIKRARAIALLPYTAE